MSLPQDAGPAWSAQVWDITGLACVKVVEDGSISGCAEAFYTTLHETTGEFTGGLELAVHTDWDESPDSDEGSLRMFVHELGHFLGLTEYEDPCGSDDAAMHDSFSWTGSPLDSLTINDYLPVTNTTYGGNTTATCGW